MASINQYGDKWRAEVRRKGYKAKCKTFATKAAAVRWARDIETAIDSGSTSPQASTLTVADLVDAHAKMRGQARPISDSSTEHYQIKAIKAGLGHHIVAKMTPDDLKSYAIMRRDEDRAGPYTINQDISKLGTILRYGAAHLRVSLPDIVGAARPLLAHLRLIGGGGRRERRPDEDELIRLVDWLDTHRGRVYAEAVTFAATSAMRRGEICAIKHGDINQATHCATVARKHPRKGKTIETVPLLGEAWDIVCRQPASVDGRVFPLHIQTLSKYFKEACDALGITDLHLHDLRHEGTSRLFEAGYQIQEVALVTGHKSWVHLKRYTNLRPQDLTKADTLRADAAKPAELASAAITQAALARISSK
jgi:integrase